jgi:hypothetical protein
MCCAGFSNITAQSVHVPVHSYLTFSYLQRKTGLSCQSVCLPGNIWTSRQVFMKFGMNVMLREATPLGCIKFPISTNMAAMQIFYMKATFVLHWIYFQIRRLFSGARNMSRFDAFLVSETILENHEIESNNMAGTTSVWRLECFEILDTNSIWWFCLLEKQDWSDALLKLIKLSKLYLVVAGNYAVLSKNSMNFLNLFVASCVWPSVRDLWKIAIVFNCYKDKGGTNPSFAFATWDSFDLVRKRASAYPSEPWSTQQWNASTDQGPLVAKPTFHKLLFYSRYAIKGRWELPC